MSFISSSLSFQKIAYGIECEVNVCPYEEDAMTLMDYRTNYASNPTAEVRARQKEGGREGGRRERLSSMHTKKILAQSSINQPPISHMYSLLLFSPS
jgi:hypothetical protein